MRKYSKNLLFIITFMAIIYSEFSPITVHAWGDNGGGRESYTKDQINNGAIGATEISDGENYKESDNYPGTIVFNSISDSTIGSEKNFVGARECVLLPDGTWEGATKETIWNADEINVKSGQTYIVRAYVHNNNPNGMDAVAENTTVEFVVPQYESAKELKVSAVIDSSNATPSRYWDGVTFKSDRAFHLEYVYGSALLENNGIGKGGLTLSDNIIDGGTLIGYDKLDGRVPGCYQYANYVTIKVKAVFDDFMVETQVRHAGDKEWQDTIDAKVGDMVEIQIEYKNLSDKDQTNVVLRDILPPNLRYIEGSIKLKNANYPNGATANGSALVGDNGWNVGGYTAGSNAFVMFTAEVVDDCLADGQNTLINWGRASVNGEKLLKDDARVIVQKLPKSFIPTVSILSLGILACSIIIILLIRKMIINRRK